MMLLLRVFGRLAWAVMVCWFAGCVVSFVSGFLIALLPIPLGLPLPWSGFEDFVETPDGRVFVNLRFYNRVLCYDRSGEFLGAHRVPLRARGTDLAAGRDGVV